MKSPFYRYGFGFFLALLGLLLVSTSAGSAAASPAVAATPTAIPEVTPVVGPNGYRLKAWASGDAIDALKDAQDRWYREKLDFPGSEGYVEYRYYLDLLERETLARYPGDIDVEEMNWQLAYYQALGYEDFKFNESNTERFTSALEEALNSGHVSLDALKTWLPSHNFQVLTLLPANNLFGDKKSATVLQISVSETYDENMRQQAIFIVQGEQNNFKVIPLVDHDLWSFSSDYNYGRNDTITIKDLNGDDQPEILIQTDRSGPNACSTDLAVYEWQPTDTNGQFTNIATDIPGIISTDFACDSSWSFEDPQKSEAQLILQKEKVPAYAYNCPDYVTTTRFKWIGTHYQRFDQSVDLFTPTQDLICNIDWADRAGANNAQSLGLLESALVAEKDVNAVWGPAAYDYLKFKLGTWYAFHGQIDLARTTLESVRDHPTQSAYLLPSNLAKVFLENFQGSADTFIACRSTNAVFNVELDRIASTTDFVVLYDEMASRWGFVEPHWSRYQAYYSNSACDENAAFQSSIMDFSPKSENELFGLLREHQIPVEVVRRADLDANGLSDWVIILADTPAFYKTSTMWLAIAQGVQLVAIRPNFYLGNGGLYTTVQQCQVPLLMEPVNTLNVGRNRFLFQLKLETAGFYAKTLNTTTGDAADFPTATDVTKAAQIAKACGLPANNLWDAKQQRFVTLAGTRAQSLDGLTLAQTEILDMKPRPNHDTLVKAAQLLQVTLNSPARNDLFEDAKVRLRYLQGLAYELAGNTNDARDVYWQLWHDYPESPYALIAQRKLERIQP